MIKGLEMLVGKDASDKIEALDLPIPDNKEQNSAHDISSSVRNRMPYWDRKLASISSQSSHIS